VELFLQQVLNGLTLGGIYGLIALGLTLVYGIMSVPNFAHGAFYMVGAFCAFLFTTRLGFGYWSAMAAAALCTALLAVLSERLVFYPLRHAPELSPMIAAIGLMLFLEAGAQAIWGADFHHMSGPWSGVLNIGGIVAPIQRLLIIAAAFGLMLALELFLHRTALGSTILAVAQNREGAALMGIDPHRVEMLTYAISGALAAIAAALFAPINLVYPAMGQLVILKAFVIIILGGMGSVRGAIVGGLIIGLAESFGAFYVSSDYEDLIAFALLIVILSLRPQGLFATKLRTS